ncbi:hypothetical protein PL11201_130052 [Planktothrix sp. PCC 11201]|uniref:hypothetical protein n=1 Tax=Planktothrix sp. PCC 11201 TaxID=1729650 RepID=UPI000923D935|nr:hypothetical protein [Planktothrix sp. PCC 11201]SKB11286.1 hypothetical protein PL11201_130052 [Planktothrix sp. PCC 11201]
MSNFITVLMISTIVSVPQSFDPQPQIMEQRDPEQIQFFKSREFPASLNSDQIKITHHSHDDQNTEDISPKRGDGRRNT